MDIPEVLLEARRTLDSISEYFLLNDWEWESIQKKWYLRFSISINEEIELGKTTFWVAIVDQNFPKGDIEIYPDFEKGIDFTFPHQSNNGLESINTIWKSGKLCLDYPGLLDEKSPENEFILRWYMRRAVEWINDANKSELLKKGDYFELPQYNIQLGTTICYDEDSVSLSIWESREIKYGFVDLKKINDRSVYAATRYSDSSNRIVYEPVWGTYISSINLDVEIGAWILLDEMLRINCWQAPNTFEELKRAFQKQNIDLVEILKNLFPQFRDGKRHFLLIGFPIPLKFGEAVSSIVWEAFLLPKLSNGKNYDNGFRNNELGWIRNDFRNVVTNKLVLDWVKTENWNARNILNRGKYNTTVTKNRFLVIGAGSLSAFVCEQLIRNGVEDLTIIDSDSFIAGNLCRHVLTIGDISKSKSIALKEHLNIVNPHARVEAINDDFGEDRIAALNRYDVILDCSANADVLKLISKLNLKQNIKFISLSFGYNANQLYITSEQINSFSYEKYVNLFKDAILKENKEIPFEDFPWEGIGCWSPVFPAKTSDLMLAASTAVGIIADIFEKGITEDINLIYQKRFDENGFLIGYEPMREKQVGAEDSNRCSAEKFPSGHLEFSIKKITARLLCILKRN